MNTFTIYFECDNCTHIQSLKIKSDKCFYQIEGQYLDEDKRQRLRRVRSAALPACLIIPSVTDPLFLAGQRDMSAWNATSS